MPLIHSELNQGGHMGLRPVLRKLIDQQPNGPQQDQGRTQAAPPSWAAQVVDEQPQRGHQTKHVVGGTESRIGFFSMRGSSCFTSAAGLLWKLRSIFATCL